MFSCQFVVCLNWKQEQIEQVKTCLFISLYKEMLNGPIPLKADTACGDAA